MITPVILCGGSGRRLWPLSRKSYPKQFVPLVNGRSLLQLTLERVKPLAEANALVCVGAEEHRFLIKEAMDAARIAGPIILEPVARNTAAAMALAALQAPPSQQLLFVPADQHIPDVAAFLSMLQQALAAAEHGRIALFGVTPSFPSTGYGYIEHGEQLHDGGFEVLRFIEKPDMQKAQELLLSRRVVWNAGIFLCTAATLLAEMKEHAPDILDACRHSLSNAQADGDFLRPDADVFASCRSESIDYAVIEKSARVVMYPFSGAWSDVGSWNAVADLSASDAAGNRVAGNGVTLRCETTYIHSPVRLVVALGTKDLLIVDTPDALLVAARCAAEQVKAVVDSLEAEQRPEALAHRKVARPWGWYDSMEAGERFQVKHIHVKPGASLSLQMHHHRAEHWIVVRGTAEVTRGSKTFLVSENQSTYIPLGEVHRLRNPGKTELEMIEVQSGSYLEEDDIVRFEDSYGRARPLEPAK